MAAIKNVKKRLLFAVMDALVDLKSESVKKTTTENSIPNTSNRQDAPSRRHVGLQQSRAVQSHVTVVHEVTTSGGGCGR